MDISAAIFCKEVAARVPDMFCNFSFVKNDKIVNNSTTTTAREKISADLEFLVFQNVFDVGFAKFKNNQILLNKNSNNVYWVKYTH